MGAVIVTFLSADLHFVVVAATSKLVFFSFDVNVVVVRMKCIAYD